MHLHWVFAPCAACDVYVGTKDYDVSCTIGSLLQHVTLLNFLRSKCLIGHVPNCPHYPRAGLACGSVRATAGKISVRSVTDRLSNDEEDATEPESLRLQYHGTLEYMLSL